MTLTPGEAVARKQRGILDDTGHADVPVEWFTITDARLSNPHPIYDALVLADLAAAAPRPSLWTRTPDWVIAAAAVAVFVLLLASPWLAS